MTIGSPIRGKNSRTGSTLSSTSDGGGGSRGDGNITLSKNNIMRNMAKDTNENKAKEKDGGGSVSLGGWSLSPSGDRSSSGSGTGSGTAVRRARAAKRKQVEMARAVWNSRMIFASTLLVVAAILGFLAYYFFTKSEDNLATTQFYSIAERALSHAVDTTRLKRLGTITMATVIGNAQPNADDWPFVIIEGYDEAASRLVATISGDGIGFAPIVKPDQLEQFEEFAYDAYYNVLGYPNDTAVSSFGIGVWGRDLQGTMNITAEDQKYHELATFPNATTTYNSPYQVFTPVLQHSDGATARPLMLNLHYEALRGETIDNIIRCSEQEKVDNSDVECGQISDLLLLTQRRDPAGLFMQPIYPNKNRTKLTGIISSPMVWHDVLANAFAPEVSGVDCVLNTNKNKTYTYYIENGVATLKGEGDLHDRDYSTYESSIELTDLTSGLFSNASAHYTLHLYPADEFFDVYSTDNPAIASVGAILIILFTSLSFFFYDFNVQEEFVAKDDLLAAKRSFVRFVSHEVRTPLNSVCMGLTLMREEISKFVQDHHANGNDNGNTATNGLSQSSPEETSPPKNLEDNNPSKTTGESMDAIRGWRGLTDEVLGNAQSAVDVLNDFLNYDKISTGTLKLELNVLKIDFLIEHAQTEFKLPAAKKKINIVVNYDKLESSAYLKHGSRIVGDDVRLIQVLRNLVSNALKFTPEGGNVNVDLSWTDQLAERGKQTRKGGDKVKKFSLKTGQQVSLKGCGFLQLSVADTGAGMSQDQVANVFHEGTQFNVNELQAGQGSGLGLYIAKGIMDQHGGSLTAASQGLGLGTVFTMTIPVFYDESKPGEQDNQSGDSRSYTFKSQASNTMPDPGEFQPLHILVVDDATTNRKLLMRLLKNHGHSCDGAEDGDVAVKLVEESMKKGSGNVENEDVESGGIRRYDSILMDYEMPTMNGPVACQHIRRMGCDAFIVGITGNVLSEDVNYFKSCGANEVLPKPFNITDLEELWVEYGVGARASKTETTTHQVSFTMDVDGESA